MVFKIFNPRKNKFGDLMEESSVSEQIPGGEIGVKGKSDANAKNKKSIPRGKAKEIPSAPCSKGAKAVAENEESDSKRSKGDEGNSSGKDEAKENGNQKQTKDNSKPIEPPKDYIHVRARRDQATDSHSLAERVRREKISERMKFLQDLVPGCNKVTGKAVMLDEIINYVQSLQRQVEFLSMKLSTVNPRMDFNMEALLSKDIPDGEIRTKGKSRANAKNRKSILRGKGKEMPSSPCYKDAKAAAENEESDSKRSKGDEGNSSGKDEEKENGNQKQTKDNSRPIEPPKDYIHVRARRGQATDSHSLVERIRREKISERMKFLQDLVPGCNKVTGKAVMLDKIINYVQSLQRQVEFLSMKLFTVNPRMDFNMEALLSKDIFQSQGTLPHNIYPVDTTSAQAFPYTYQSQQGSNIHRNIPNGAETHGLKTASILDFSKRLFCFLFRTCNECCKFSIKDYEEKAVALTLFRSKLQDLTKRLEASRLTCPLFDTACWARNLERAYFKMWNLYCCGQHPQPSKVTENNSEFPYDQ